MRHSHHGPCGEKDPACKQYMAGGVWSVDNPDPEPYVMTELPCGDRIVIEAIAGRPGMISISSMTRLDVIYVAKDSLRALSKLFAEAVEKWG